MDNFILLLSPIMDKLTTLHLPHYNYGAHYHPYHHYPPYPRQHFSEPNYHNQNSFQQYNHNSYNFHAGPSSSNGQQASQSVKRPLTDVTNTFTFKKPRSGDKTFINL